VRSFKPYLISAIAFAALFTALIMNKGVGAFVGKFDILVFVPVVTAILISGNAHAPSEFGIYLGFFIEWFIVGVALGAVVWLIRRRRTDAAT
jgi:hypothetical protein